MNQPTTATFPETKTHLYKTQGIGLNIDTDTQLLCQTYNTSSAATRSVLYILLISLSIAMFAVFNNNSKFNWKEERIASLVDSIKRINNKDTVIRELHTALAKTRIDGFARSSINNEYTVTISILGLSIDINDLASVSGLVLVILLTLLRFTMVREKSNLTLALQSVSERYTDTADYSYFKEKIQQQNADNNEIAEEKNKNSDNVQIETKNGQEQTLPLHDHIANINYARRRYHYNFLSMNEIFNLPFLDTSSNKLQESRVGKFVNLHFFYLFFGVYSYIMFNDFCSYQYGFRLNTLHTTITMAFSLAFYFLSFNICEACLAQKRLVYELFNGFKNSQYTYKPNNYNPTGLPARFRFLIPLACLFVIYLVAWGFRNIPESDLTCFNKEVKRIMKYILLLGQ